MVEEAPLDRLSFGEQLSEAIIHAFAFKVGHHGLV
jgi:hypothetical protein